MKKDLQESGNRDNSQSADDLITLFLCGDVMTGRGIDQVLPHPGDPRLYEPFITDARDYVSFAEKANGPIGRPVSFSYVWGDALTELKRVAPDVRIINLETSITQSKRFWENKGIHYRMHPDNVPCLTAAGIDYCSLANNHVLDWGYAGLAETLETLDRVHIQYSGAGQNPREARAPAVMEVPGKGRVIVYSCGLITSGIPNTWAASGSRPGVNLLKDQSTTSVWQIRNDVRAIRRQGDVVVVSIHWGGNWGYPIPPAHRHFAHQLIEEAGVDLIHGHSSHHVKGIEVYRDRLILYGCGDFLTDYEGIPGYEAYRGDLSLMYFASVDPSTGRLVHLRMTPLHIEKFRLNKTSPADAMWLGEVLNREGKPSGTRVTINPDHTLYLIGL